MLDVGANIGASASQLSDFALMGAAMARAIFHIERPSVGLLNVGTEDVKGNEDVKAAHALLKGTDLPLDYKGFVEGDQIGQGAVDVVVVEGFAGNIALKTAEGTARQIGTYLKGAMTSSLVTKLGALLARGGFRVLKEKMDPRRVNGGTFLGLNGIAVKSHGGTDAYGFASAVDLAYEMADSGLIARLAADIDSFHHKLAGRAARRACSRRALQSNTEKGKRVAVLRSIIRGVGAHLPKRIVTNDELAKTLDTSDEWIQERSGISQRHIADDSELTSDLGAAAAKQALIRAGIDPVEIDLVICATATPDRTFPATAVRIQQHARRHQGRGVRCAGRLLRLRLSR